MTAPTITAPAVGDLAPGATLQHTSGEPVALASLWERSSRGLALVFLRHYGCPFCKQHAAALQSHQNDLQSVGITVALVGCGTLDEANAFVTDMKLTLPLLNDPERHAYAAYGLGEASPASLLNPSVLIGAARALTQGYVPKRSSGSPMQLQGQFLIDRRGILRTADRPSLMSDIPSVDALLAAAPLLEG